ncbi:DUF7446 family protein [Jeotgalibaca porci]|uniref:DUF7446 family protein n=1 Tax=Jeotgalibaca porci TaxID=1868793 RepID=UPI0035A106BA
MKKLIVTFLSKKIVYATITKSGLIGNDRKDMTEEVLDVVQDWFLQTGYKMRQIHLKNGSNPTLFHTNDPDKINEIKKILFSDEEVAE